VSLLLACPTIEKLHALHWTGMAQSWEARRHLPDIDTLSFEESLGLLLDVPRARPPVRKRVCKRRHGAFRRLPGGYCP
jgi:hypothetical protein